MEAPKGRYRVEEKDGRLVVFDNGAPIDSSIPSRSGSPGTGPSGPIAPGKGAIDSIADFLLGIVVREWDEEGRAVIRWQWNDKGTVRRWDARLDARQQRRLARALLRLCAAPFFILAFVVGSNPFSWIVAALALPTVIWGLASILRLQSETAGSPEG
jgi:hypothetical protein